jgi:hypothetical protein
MHSDEKKCRQFQTYAMQLFGRERKVDHKIDWKIVTVDGLP